MYVIDLNGFLRRAKKAGILSSLLVEFRQGTYDMGVGLLTVAPQEGSFDGLVMTNENGATHRWGLSLQSGSSEIIDLRRISGKKLVGGQKILVKLGRKCSGRGRIP